MNVQEIFDNSTEKFILNENTHYIGEMDIEYKQIYDHLWPDFTGGDYKYIGTLRKDSKQPSGLGRLIDSRT